MRMNRMEISVFVRAKRESAAPQILAGMVKITGLIAGGGRALHTMLRPVQERHLFNIIAACRSIGLLGCRLRLAVQLLIVSVEFENQESGIPASPNNVGFRVTKVSCVG